MRILAIRGRNIASLAGEFEVDFRSEPLASAGLFAICGPTGSGKSTLLDVLCLALYERTPRLEKAGRGDLPDVREETITPKDARNLLRRGTADGWAEVDFLGTDGEEYRARWSARRARARLDGKLQASEISLVGLRNGERVPGTKGEVLDVIAARLGLNFGQFTRAVLLAQNEFTAFLQADDGARAELLEQLTGTDVYSVLSIRAYQRSTTEQKALDELKGRIGDNQPLDESARAALEEQWPLAVAHAEAVKKEVESLDAQLRWHEELEKARGQEESARESLARSVAAKEAAAERTAHLALVESVQPAASYVAEHDRAAEVALESREVALPAAQRLVDRSLEQFHAAESAAAHARNSLDQAEERHRAAVSGLAQAIELDAQIAALGQQHAEASRRLAEAVEADVKAQQALAEARAEREVVAEEHRQASEWIQRHEERRALSEGWARWDALLAEAASAERERGSAIERRAEAEAASAAARERLSRAEVERAAAEGNRQAAGTDLDEAQARLAEFDVAAIAGERRRADARRQALMSAQQEWANLASLTDGQAVLSKAACDQREKVRTAEAALNEIEARLVPARAARDQADRAYEEVRQASSKNIEKLRGALEAGRPCPVCGATEHPYVSAGQFLDEALGTLKRQARECQQQFEVLSGQASDQRAVVSESRRRQAEIDEEAAALVPRQAAALAAWQANPLSAETAALENDARAAWLTGQLTATARRLDELEAQEAAAREAAVRREAARTALDAARAGLDAAQRSETDARLSAQTTVAVLVSAKQAVGRAEEQRDRLLVQLDGAGLGEGWRAGWQADPDGFRRERQRDAAEWLDCTRAVASCETRLGRLDATIAASTRATEKTAADLARAREDGDRVGDQLSARRDERLAVFDGRPADEVRRELEEDVRSSRAATATCEDALVAARSSHAAAEARLTEAQRQAEQCEAAAASARATLDDWLAGRNRLPGGLPLDLAGLKALLAHDAEWIARERESLQALDGAIDRARAVLDERRGRREAIEAGRTTGESAEVLEIKRRDAAAALKAAEKAHYDLQNQVEEDDKRRVKARDLAGEIARQARVAAVWARMNELIGSADGKKFRNYAQQLTLDVLLEYANQHLADLARRYRLRRLPDRLALIVVDRDMGDEVRSVYSLSGGESFLVSLALALGLASLSANRVRVESLFIDEGFGALDADTLDVAMDALDRLHAQGRKVGVISHVQEMSERIATRVSVERQSGGRSRVVIG